MDVARPVVVSRCGRTLALVCCVAAEIAFHCSLGWLLGGFARGFKGLGRIKHRLALFIGQRHSCKALPVKGFRTLPSFP